MNRRFLAPLLICVAACAPVEDAGEPVPVSTTIGEILPGSIDTPEVPPDGDSATVVDVLDGDSLRVVLESGEEEEIRLLGINTPESDECFGDQAKQVTEALVADADVVLVASGDADRDQFGRLLRYVFLDDGTLVNDRLLRSGVALALSGDHEFELVFRDAEETAFESGAGLWGIGVCGEMGSTDVRIVDIEYNPSGPDDENTNGEFVDIANTGSTSVDMTGWVLRDESTRHRFTFENGFTLDPGADLRIVSGCGDDSAVQKHWCAGGPVWSNGGDTALLLDVHGNIVSRVNYLGDF